MPAVSIARVSNCSVILRWVMRCALLIRFHRWGMGFAISSACHAARLVVAEPAGGASRRSASKPDCARWLPALSAGHSGAFCRLSAITPAFLSERTTLATSPVLAKTPANLSLTALPGSVLPDSRRSGALMQPRAIFARSCAARQPHTIIPSARTAQPRMLLISQAITMARRKT